MARNLLDDEAMQNLATYITKMPTLEDLDISSNIIREPSNQKSKALENIFSGILSLKHSLRKLSISSNKGL
jgi:hypothetical protein